MNEYVDFVYILSFALQFVFAAHLPFWSFDSVLFILHFDIRAS